MSLFKFKFTDSTDDKIYSKIQSLDPKKAFVQNDIPAKILIGTNDYQQLAATFQKFTMNLKTLKNFLIN